MKINQKLNEKFKESKGLLPLRSLSVSSFLKVGGHLGNQDLHRSQKLLSIGRKNGIWIYDGELMKRSLRVAFVYLNYFKERKGGVLVINKEEYLKKAVSVFCDKMGFYHMQEKWMGGLLTNWSESKKQKDHFLKVQKSHGKELEKKGDRLYNKIKTRYTGIEKMSKLPSLCVILDIEENRDAFKEAQRLRIPVVAFLNTDHDLSGVDVPIFGANKSLSWIRWVFNLFLVWDFESSKITNSSKKK